MDQPWIVDRRTFVAQLGRGAVAIAVLGVAGCGPGAGDPAPATPGGNASTPDAATPVAGETPSASMRSGPASADTATWRRVNLGFVSAYVVVRHGEAAIVDTSLAGSAGAIESALAAIGLDWTAVGHLVLTHHHADHAGSAMEVMERAPEAAAYAGAEDIAAISAPRPLSVVGDGDRVFDLEIVTAPGHTAGSICTLDPEAGILIAGDALRTESGQPALPNAQFTADMDLALESIAKLGALSFETLLVGHGEPLEGGAGAAVAALVAAS